MTGNGADHEAARMDEVKAALETCLADLEQCGCENIGQTIVAYGLSVLETEYSGSDLGERVAHFADLLVLEADRLRTERRPH